MNTELGLFFILFGVFFAVFHAKLSQFAVNRWYRWFPGIKIWDKFYDAFFLVSGMVFAIFGLLTILNVIEMK